VPDQSLALWRVATDDCAIGLMLEAEEEAAIGSRLAEDSALDDVLRSMVGFDEYTIADDTAEPGRWDILREVDRLADQQMFTIQRIQAEEIHCPIREGL